MIYSCCNQNRKAAVLGNPNLNGIDYLEVLDQDAIALDSPQQQTLLIHCLKAVPTALTPENVMIEGGESITGIVAVWVAPANAPPTTQTNTLEQAYFEALPNAADILLVRTNAAGDFSTYTLRLVNDASTAGEDPFEVTEALTGFDPQLASIEFSFKVECGPDFDCAPQPPDCPLPAATPPPINYLAKDYGSFRQIILDRLNQLLPTWGGTSEADLGIALAELIAYQGDYLSYQQDAIATEAYLETARSRVSLRRHALLVDYHVHDGCNARTWIQLTVAGEPGDAVFLDRSLTRFYTYAPGMPSTLAVGAGNEEAALLSGVQVFEPMQDSVLYPEHNQMTFYTWGDTDCCLVQGATEATLAGTYPNLQPGDVLIFEEVLGPQTGDPADADIRHRCAVRLTQVATQDASGNLLVDPLFDQNGNPISNPATWNSTTAYTPGQVVAEGGNNYICLVSNSGQEPPNAAYWAVQNPTPVTEIQWSQDDALPFPLCISSTYPDSNGDELSSAWNSTTAYTPGQVVADGGNYYICLVANTNQAPPNAAFWAIASVSAAFGNVVLADHGLSFSGKQLDPGTVPAPRLFYPPNPAADRCQTAAPTPLPVRYRPTVPDSPLSQAVPLLVVTLPAVGIPVTSGVLLLDGTSPVSLSDSSGFACLTLQATNPAGWPQYFGVVASSGSNPGSFNLSVVYNPPAGAAGIEKQVTVEQFANLSLTPSAPNYAATQINSNSKLIQVPSNYTPATLPASFPATPTMLPNTGTVDLQSAGVTYLTLQAASPAGWPSYFGVLAQPSASLSSFDLQVLYDPSSGVGVGVPVLVEQFTSLSLSAAAGDVNGSSELITVESFAQTPDASLSAYDLMNFDPSDAVPVITLDDGTAIPWTPEQNLLGSSQSDRVFVVEIESDGTARLRFATPADPDSAESTNGMVPDSGTVFVADYRIGNGTAGNVGADSLVYLAAADARIQSCTNPLPATGGIDPETNDQIRRRAPQAFLTQERAVTMTDYEAVAENNPQVDQAVASLRWTGSWYTVFIAVEPEGGGNLTSTLQKTLKNNVELYRLAGQDLKLESPQYVSLQITLKVLVDPSYFQSDVEESLMQVLGNQILPNGQKGLFYPDNFTFGQTVYLSPVYAAARSVAGVVSVMATQFQPQGVNSTQYLTAGQIKLGAFQVARLANDPNFPDHGQLTLVMEGGK